MTMRRDDDESGDAAKRPGRESESPREVRRRGRIITAQDAGWISPTTFVAPLTFVPVDPPRPLNRRVSEGG